MANFTVTHTETWDVTKPAGARVISLGDDDIREFKRAEIERQAVDHQRFTDESGKTNVGTHKKVSITDTQSSDPTTYDDTLYLYQKAKDTVKTPYLKTAAGKVQEIGESFSGLVQMFAGLASAIPSGWLLCNGAAVSRTTYASLFSAIGTRYGAGDTTTTFNLPTMTAKFPLGIADNPGTGSGSNTHDHGAATGGHSLTAAENGAHTHSVLPDGSGNSAGTGNFLQGCTADDNYGSLSTGSSGSGTAHTHPISSADNIPENTTFLFIIKT